MNQRRYHNIFLLLLLAAGGLGFYYFSSSQNPFERAEAMYVRGEYVSAFKVYRILAREGDPRAQFTVARFYEEGLGRNISDPRQAVAWYTEAAEAGYRPAMFALGLMYYEGDLIDEDLVRSELWWGRAADRNDHRAWERLVRLYPITPGAATLDKKLWYMDENIFRLRGLAAGGEAFALVLLGNFHVLGRGVDENPGEAVRLFREAAEAGNAAGRYSLGRMYLAGLPGLDNRDEGAALILAAANQGHRAAQLFMAELYLAGRGMPESREEALFWTLVALREAAGPAALDADKLIAAREAGLGWEALGDIRGRARNWRPEGRPEMIQAARGLYN